MQRRRRDIRNDRPHLYELAPSYPGVEIETVCGVSAVISGAGILGAPLIHDFAVISLSDLLTPWEKIEKRLSAASQSDMVICLYNPSSMKRKDYTQEGMSHNVQIQEA